MTPLVYATAWTYVSRRRNWTCWVRNGSSPAWADSTAALPVQSDAVFAGRGPCIPSHLQLAEDSSSSEDSPATTAITSSASESAAADLSTPKRRLLWRAKYVCLVAAIERFAIVSCGYWTRMAGYCERCARLVADLTVRYHGVAENKQKQHVQVSRCPTKHFWWSRDVRSRVFSRPMIYACSLQSFVPLTTHEF